jgi:hypothetical protein
MYGLWVRVEKGANIADEGLGHFTYLRAYEP